MESVLLKRRIVGVIAFAFVILVFGAIPAVFNMTFLPVAIALFAIAVVTSVFRDLIDHFRNRAH